MRAVADKATTPRGVLALGANEATCLYVLPDIFAEYHRLYPSVQISIYRNFSHKVLQKVEDGSIDVGIVTLPAKSPSLKFHAIFRDRVMLMVNPRNPLAKLKSVRMKDIAEQPLIFPRTGYTRQLLDKHFRPYKPQLQITMELTSVGMIKCFVAAGLGVSLISASFARNEVRAGEVKLIPIAGRGIVARTGTRLPPRPHAAAFLRGIHRASSAARRRKSGSGNCPAAQSCPRAGTCNDGVNLPVKKIPNF